MLLTRSKTFPILCTLSDGDEAKYVQAKIYDKSGVLVDTVSVPHSTLGNYLTTYTYAGSEAVLNVYCKVFTDAGFTTPDTSHTWESDQVVFDDSYAGTPPTAAAIRAEIDSNSTQFALTIKLLRNAHKITSTGGGTLYIYDGNTDAAAVLEQYELYDADGNRTKDDFVYMKRVTA